MIVFIRNGMRQERLIMENKGTVRFFATAAVLATLVMTVFVQGCEKKRRIAGAAVEQGRELAEHDRKISQLVNDLSKYERKLTEQVRKLSEVEKGFTKQDQRLLDHSGKLLVLTEVERRLERAESRLAGVESTTGEVKVSGIDSSEMKKLITEQVKVNVKSAEAPKIGLISVQQVFIKCKRNEAYIREAMDERQRLETELTELLGDIEADEGSLKKMKAGSVDRMDRVQDVLRKRGDYQAKKEYYKLRIELKDQQWSERLYEDILRISREVAVEKGLAFVLENSQPELPAASAEELRLTIRTNKVIYGGASEDITEEVLRRLDTEDEGEGQ